MNKYHNWSVSEMEQEAIRSENTLALAFVERVKDIEDVVKFMSDDPEELKRDIECIKFMLGLENNF